MRSTSTGKALQPPLRTPDGRYIVVEDRLWRATNPSLSEPQVAALQKQLMDARRDVKAALKSGCKKRLLEARRMVNAAKIALGERGPVWWDDREKDYNRYLIKNTPYAEWYAKKR